MVGKVSFLHGMNVKNHSGRAQSTISTISAVILDTRVMAQLFVKVRR
jgi:hypothetical protein